MLEAWTTVVRLPKTLSLRKRAGERASVTVKLPLLKTGLSQSSLVSFESTYRVEGPGALRLRGN